MKYLVYLKLQSLWTYALNYISFVNNSELPERTKGQL